MRRAAAGAGAIAIVVTALVPTAARAETAYRYWSYWTGGEQWSYAARGPGFSTPPADGVEGWRFVVSPKDGSQATPPSASSRYADLCPTAAPAPEGQKRVAVVLDFGIPGIAPVGQTPPPESVSCITAPAAATGLQILQEVAGLRFHPSGLICGIAGFPATECPGQSNTRATTPAPKRSMPVPPPAMPTVVAPTVTPAEPGPRTARTGSATPPPPSPAPVYSQASPVALPLRTEDPAADAGGAPPPWIAAIGAAMIASLIALAALVRRGRQ